MAQTSEQIARRILNLLDERHTKPGEHDMFAAIKSRLANEDIHGDDLEAGVEFGVSSGWFSLKGPRIWRTAAVSTAET